MGIYLKGEVSCDNPSCQEEGLRRVDEVRAQVTSNFLGLSVVTPIGELPAGFRVVELAFSITGVVYACSDECEAAIRSKR